MNALVPGVDTTTSQMPKLFAGQYGAEISALLAAAPDVIHSSLWSGDLEAFVLQAVPRNLFRNSHLVLTAGEPEIRKLQDYIPDGTIIGARGPHSVFAPDNELNRWFNEYLRETVPAARRYIPPIIWCRQSWGQRRRTKGKGSK